MSVYEKSSAASANCQIFVIELKIPFSFHSDQQNPHEQWTWPDWRGETGFKWRHSGLQHQTGLSLRRVRSLWQNFRGHDKRRGKPLLIRTQHGRDLVFSGNFSQLVVFGASDALMIHRWFFDLQVTEHYSFEHQLHDLFYNEPETMLERAKSDEFGPRESRHASIQQTLHSRSDNQGSHSMHFCQK